MYVRACVCLREREKRISVFRVWVSAWIKRQTVCETDSVCDRQTEMQVRANR